MIATENDKLLKLYELIINEEHYFIGAHQGRIAFYSGFVTALVAATITGLFKASEWYHLVVLHVGPILIFAVSTIAIEGTFRLYQRFLEAITMRAKIEQKLGLTSHCSDNTEAGDLYWQSESIIPCRHIENRKSYESSDDFIKEHSQKGYHLQTILLFRVFQCLSGMMFVGILFLTIWKTL